MPADSVRRRRAPLLLSLATILAASAGAPKVACAGDASGLFADFLTSRFAEAEADPGAASRAALEALALEPGNPNLLNQAFLSTARAGRPEALGFARLLPGEPFAELLVATSAVQRGDWAEAALAANRLPKDGVMQVLRPLLLAWIDQEQHRTDDALRRLDALIQDGRFAGPLALHAGMIADLAGRPSQAASYFNAAQNSLGPLGMRAAQIVASFYARNSHQADALNLLGRIAASDAELGLVLPGVASGLGRAPIISAAGGIAEAYLAAAGTFQQQGQWDFAGLMLRYALLLKPEFSSAKLMLATIARARGQLGEAQDLLHSIPEDSVLRPVGDLHRAQILHQEGDDAGALGLLATLAGRCPQSALPLTQQAEILRADGRLGDATGALDAAIARVGDGGSSAWALYYQRAMLRDQMNQWPAAEADLRHALALAPNQPAVLNYLGYSWAERDEHLNEAAQMIARADATDPNDGAIVDSMGWVMLKRGDVSGAVRMLERASELMPADATVNGHLGDAYEAAGRMLEARYQWQRALNLHPDATEAGRLRMKLDDRGVRQSARAQTEG